ncbi:PAS domain S-box protein [Methanoregula sp.]|uniref:hybrid sensor histidine kinase/response regulator n=1 Tax=Methanoregula sp. TaxID=2052170 RepID=UPI00237033F5|nr:PAS domain S-box protein [Methanoregula sp.]MDD1685875.1 PAS domain S-box protein [Methanoregula sp.]
MSVQKRKSILIVEDEAISAMNLKTTLISLGYRVTGIASSGERAIEMADEETPDLILMDIHLAGRLSGIEAAEQILVRHSVPVIYVTAYADPGLVNRAKLTKPYGYIIKPYDEREIRTRIEIALYKSEWDRNLLREYENLEQRVIERTEDLTQMNAALQKSETRYRLLFERSGEGIFIFEAEGEDRGRIIEVNNTGAAMHGYLPEELLNLKITDLDVAEDLPVTPARFEDILRGKWIGGEINHMRKDGSEFPLDFQAGLLELDGHNYVFYVMRDISERRRIRDALEASETRYRRLFETTHDGILILDADTGQIVEVNPFLIDMLGFSHEQFLGKKIWEIGVFRDIVANKDNFKELQRQEHIRYENLPLETSDGRNIAVEFVSNIYTVENKKIIQCNIRDITARKSAEEALLQVNRKLTMLNSITRHDILNQLMGLQTYLELSKEGVTDPVILTYIEKEEQAAKAIQWQIEFARNYQDIGAQAPKWQIVSGIISSAIRQLNPPGTDINVNVSDVELFADPLIEKVFYNLMENSLRHGERVTRMDFSSRESENGLVLTFCDNGVGISDADKTRLFQKGFGKHTGLGLFLSREILAITEITITENGEPGRGARFEITVPIGAWRHAGQT